MVAQFATTSTSAGIRIYIKKLDAVPRLVDQLNKASFAKTQESGIDGFLCWELSPEIGKEMLAYLRLISGIEVPISSFLPN